MVYEEIDSAVNCKEPLIKVFAINEEVHTFITGVSEDFFQYILEYIGVTRDKIIHNIRLDLEKEKIPNVDKLIEIVRNSFETGFGDLSNDVNDCRRDAIEDTSYSIEYLPQWLLCIFADLLIRLTAVKQKTSSEIESVCVSTDILIITKTTNFK